jgi:hypothetical protein
MSNNKFKPLYGLQPPLERFARLEEVAQGIAVGRLDGKRGIVGGCVKEWRFGEVEEDYTL